ncbi:MAG: hypothetical protein WAW52_12600 [Methanothrix sp.]
MDIIEKFLPFTKIHLSRLNTDIQNHYGLGMARKYSALLDELAKARIATLGVVSVKADGCVQVTNQPGMAAIQARITELEPRISRLLEISREIGEILESEGCDPTNCDGDLGGKIKELEQKTNIAPGCWQKFNNLRSANQTALPSELVAYPGYEELETQLMLQREDAAIKIAPLRAKGAAIGKLVVEAMSL